MLKNNSFLELENNLKQLEYTNSRAHELEGKVKLENNTYNSNVNNNSMKYNNDNYNNYNNHGYRRNNSNDITTVDLGLITTNPHSLVNNIIIIIIMQSKMFRHHYNN